jgi:hypothetical protein
MPKSKQQVNVEIAERGLVSIMNDTKWAELQRAIRHELPFGPPYQMKVVLNPHPEPDHFEADVENWGDWSDECLSPFYEIEWLRVRPRCLRRRGHLLAPEVQSVESEFMAILQRFQIPYRRDGDTVWIYGYAAETSGLGEPSGAANRSQPAGSETDRASRAAGSSG